MSNQNCPLCNEELVLEYKHEGAALWTSSWCCPKKIMYLGGLQGEYAIVLARGYVNDKEKMEQAEYYYTDLSEIVIDVTMKTSSVIIQSKQFMNYSRIITLDEIKQLMIRIPKLASFV